VQDDLAARLAPVDPVADGAVGGAEALPVESQAGCSAVDADADRDAGGAADDGRAHASRDLHGQAPGRLGQVEGDVAGSAADADGADRERREVGAQPAYAAAQLERPGDARVEGDVEPGARDE
jgi:hypothetical protein